MEATFATLATILGAALEHERTRIGDVGAKLVQDDLDANEYALAHDDLVDALGNLDLLPLPGTADLLAEACRLMNHRR